MNEQQLMTFLRRVIAADTAADVADEVDTQGPAAGASAEDAGANAYHAFRTAIGANSMKAWKAWAHEDGHGKDRRAAIVRAFRGGYVRSVDGKGKGAKQRAHAALNWSPMLEGLAASLRGVQPAPKAKATPAPKATPETPQETPPAIDGDALALFAAFARMIRGEDETPAPTPAPTQVPDAPPVSRPWLTAMNGIRRAYTSQGLTPEGVGKAHPLYATALKWALRGEDADGIAIIMADRIEGAR